MQKKLILFTICFCFSIISFAQFEKGTTTVNFNIGDIRNISIRNKPFDKNNNLSFNPGVGYFIKKNWEIGARFNYTSFHLNDSSHGGSYENARRIGVDLYSNLYFGNGKLKPYLTANVGWEQSKGTYNLYGSGLSSFNNNNFYYNMGGGLNWNINSKFSLFTEATYRRDSPFNRYGHGRLNLTVGARFFFSRRKK